MQALRSARHTGDTATHACASMAVWRQAGKEIGCRSQCGPILVRKLGWPHAAAEPEFASPRNVLAGRMRGNVVGKKRLTLHCLSFSVASNSQH
jgi:hypothetical protein